LLIVRTTSDIILYNTKTPLGQGEPATSRQWILWYATCGLALWLFVSPLLFHDTFHRMTPDEAHYAWKAERISQDLTFLFSEQAWRRHPPLVPLGVGLLAKVMPLDAAILVATRTQAVLGLVMVYVLGVQLAGPVAGLVAGALLAADPTYRILSNRLLLDIPLMILFVASTWLLIRGGGCRIWAVGVGTLALFLKDYGVLTLLYALTCIAYDLLLKRGWRPITVVGALLTSSASILTLVGYFLLDYWFWIARFWSSLSSLPNRVALTLWHLLDNSVGWAVPTVQKRYLAVLLLLAVPLVARLLSLSWRREYVFIFLWITIVLGSLVAIATYVVERRVIVLFVPALYLLVGICVVQGLRLARAPRLAHSLFGLAVLGSLLAPFLARANPEVLYYTQCRFSTQYPISDWIKHNISGSGVVVFSRSSHQLQFYAGRDYERDGGIFYGWNEHTGVPRTVPEFQRVLDATSKEAYLIVDIEDKPDPLWLYPPKRSAVEAIEALGFHLVHVVWVPVGEHCQIPDSPYYSELPRFIEHLGLPLYRTLEDKRERVGALVFRREAIGARRART